VPPRARALGVAESYRDPPDGRAETSTLAGVVVHRDRSVEGVVFGSCTVGGTDATEAILECWERLDRPDVGPIFVAGIAPAWFNVLDLPAIHEATERPVIGVSFEASEGLEGAIEREFEGSEREERLATYRRQPEREAVAVGDEGDGTDRGGTDSGGDTDPEETVYCRFVGIDAEDGRELVREYTPGDSGRPEPVRVARLVARGADSWQRRGAV
jgi:endonuclease V-like protein UPF0215 family